jgi:2-oxoglutarate ferredoxin oxidoreductase subunit gamma
MKKTLQHIHRFEIRLSGLGGQGIITLGRLLGASLALGHGYHVTQTQSYGPEARGGSSRADVVISSSPISYPKTENLDLLVALSQEACNNYYRYMKRAGVLLVDTTLGLPFTRMAREKIGNPLTINTLVLGAVTHLLPFAERRLIRKSLEENLPPKIQAINVKAFNLGLRQAAKHFGEAPEIWKLAKDQANAAEEQETD